MLLVINNLAKRLLRGLTRLRREARRRARRMMYHKKVSTISSDCCGGILYHDRMQEFLSPTVNLFFSNEDFILFCMHLKEFVESEIAQKQETETKYPVGIIKTEFGSVELHFMHYDSFIDAVNNWRRRAKRLDYDNICIIMNAGKEASEEIIAKFKDIPYKNKALLTSGANTKMFSYCFNLECYEKGFSGSITKYKSNYSVKRYLDDFSFDKFIMG